MSAAKALPPLRLANVFGFEPGRPSFVGRMIDGLATNGEIHFDMSPFTRRDFAPIEAAAGCIAAILRHPPGGIVNIGSGVALQCGRLVLAVIEDWRERDAFVLDVNRLRDLIAWSVPDGRAVAREVGRRLRMRPDRST